MASVNHETYMQTNPVAKIDNFQSRQETKGNASLKNTGAYQGNGRSSSNFKSPGDLEEQDYSLSVSDLGNSMYNSSRGAALGNQL